MLDVLRPAEVLHSLIYKLTRFVEVSFCGAETDQFLTNERLNFFLREESWTLSLDLRSLLLQDVLSGYFAVWFLTLKLVFEKNSGLEKLVDEIALALHAINN